MKINAIKLQHKKNTSTCETIDLPLPERVFVPMSQSMGRGCDPIVKKGDKVFVGQKIGDSDKIKACIAHSSVSGTVVGITEVLHPSGKVTKAVEIEPDGKQELSPDIEVPVITDKESLCRAVRESGCCGLGGAGFPTHLKLNYNEQRYKVDTLIINAAECEPYITGDHREMLESPDNIITGIRLIMDTLGIENTYIGIEDNKPDAIRIMREKAAEYDNINVCPLKASYPQGAEKVLIYNTVGRTVKQWALPSDVGVIVLNVSTVGFIGRYSKDGIPLISRRITVDGDAVATPCNVNVPLGTPLVDVLKFADTNIEASDKILLGGPMMGICAYDINMPTAKTINSILAFKKPERKKNELIGSGQTACIRCGRCIRACPMGLMPTYIEKAYDKHDTKKLEKLSVGLCMNCGSCSYVCPAKRPLAEKNQLAKALLRR